MKINESEIKKYIYPIIYFVFFLIFGLLSRFTSHIFMLFAIVFGILMIFSYFVIYNRHRKNNINLYGEKIKKNNEDLTLNPTMTFLITSYIPSFIGVKKYILLKLGLYIDASNKIRKLNNNVYYIKMDHEKNYKLKIKLELFKDIYIKKSYVVINFDHKPVDIKILDSKFQTLNSHIFLLQPNISVDKIETMKPLLFHNNKYYLVKWSIKDKVYQKPIFEIDSDELCLLKAVINGVYKYDGSNNILNEDNKLVKNIIEPLDMFINSIGKCI